jgi:deoxyribonuclease V
MLADEVYALVRQIPRGKVSTYGKVAEALGDVIAARAVGEILGRNPELVSTPCHRVVYSDGRVGGYAGGVPEKTRLLAKEGVSTLDGRIKNFPEKIFDDFKGGKPLEKLRAEEETLKKKLVLEDSFSQVKTVCGVDVHYGSEGACAAAVVYDVESGEFVESKTLTTSVSFPYIQTYFSYREGPVILELLRALEFKPSVVLIDGNGILHPRGFGLASYVGVKAGIATVGVAKKLLCGKIEAKGAGDTQQVFIGGRLAGYALTPPSQRKPLYVSPGHKISPETALKTVRNLTNGKAPAPLLEAHKKSKGKSQPTH